MVSFLEECCPGMEQAFLYGPDYTTSPVPKYGLYHWKSKFFDGARENWNLSLRALSWSVMYQRELTA